MVGGYTVKHIDEMEAIYHGSFKRAAAELGVESFGMQVFDMPPNFSDYPEHDHAQDGQEEVYVVLRGAAEIEGDGQRSPLDADTAHLPSRVRHRPRCVSLDPSRDRGLHSGAGRAGAMAVASAARGRATSAD